MAEPQTVPAGLRRRYRVARTADSYVVLDTGDPDGDGLYHDDGDSPVVYEPTGGLTPEAKAKARNRAEELNLTEEAANRG